MQDGLVCDSKVSYMLCLGFLKKSKYIIIVTPFDAVLHQFKMI